MNKAFVKESEASGEYCPQCGSLGHPVSRETVLSHLPENANPALAVTANFCAHPQCDVAYFDMFERFVPVSALKQPVYPKDPDAPICACFGFTCADIEEDIAEGVVTRTKALIERTKTEPTRCEILSPTGRSCVAEVQRYYMQHRKGAT